MDGVAHDLIARLGPSGAVRSRDLVRRVDRHTVARWVRQGRLLRPHPGVLVLPDRADGGAHSELEIWGVDRVLSGPGMPRFVRQLPAAPAYGNVRLDAALPELRVAIEFDGAAFHGDPGARERDIRRDVALAALGWVVLRSGPLQGPAEPASGGGQGVLLLCRSAIGAGCAVMCASGVRASAECAAGAHSRRHRMSRTGLTTSPVAVSAAAWLISASG